MRYLLDTHIFLWWVQGERKLSPAIKSRILHASEVYISSASIWEITIKIMLNKLDANVQELVNAVAESGFLELPITILHTTTLASLPHIHRDPFDRILISQAISEPLTLLTADCSLKGYSELVETI